MEKIYTENLKGDLFSLIAKFDGKHANIMISGGSLLSLLDNEEYRNLDSHKWSIFYADERITTEEREINFLLSKIFLKHIEGKAHRLESVKTDLPLMDLILLGIGGDGHICSLFPNHALLQCEEELALIKDSPKYPPNRITVTAKFLNRHSKLHFFLTKKKASILTEPHISIRKQLTCDLVIYIEK